MKKLILFLTASFLITSLGFSQVNSSKKDDLINPDKRITAKKVDSEKAKREKEREMKLREKKSHERVSPAKKPVNSNANNPNAPVLKFNTLEHDFGTIKQNSDGSFDFTFKNEGKEPLVLSKVRSSCGCTIPTWPRQPILPGETGTIHVVYDTKRLGPFHKSIYVYSNAKKGVITLKIKGKVEKDPNAPAPAPKKVTKPAVKHTKPYKYPKKHTTAQDNK